MSYQKVFLVDFRESNPKLHRLYVENAMADLREIDRALRAFEKLGHTNMCSAIIALYNARKEMVEENAAHAEADKLMRILRGEEIDEDDVEENIPRDDCELSEQDSATK